LTSTATYYNGPAADSYTAGCYLTASRRTGRQTTCKQDDPDSLPTHLSLFGERCVFIDRLTACLNHVSPLRKPSTADGSVNITATVQITVPVHYSSYSQAFIAHAHR